MLSGGADEGTDIVPALVGIATRLVVQEQLDIFSARIVFGFFGLDWTEVRISPAGLTGS